MTMGIVAVASLAARVAFDPTVTITSTLRRTNSAAIARSRSMFPSAYRYSMTMFFPPRTQARAGPAVRPRCGPGWRQWRHRDNLSGELSLVAARRHPYKAQRAWRTANKHRSKWTSSLQIVFTDLLALLCTADLCHLITLFARSSTRLELSDRSVLPPLRLMTNSNFVACCTGKSAGLAPFKILST